MIKKPAIYTVCCFFGGAILSVVAQVGINTESPQSIFHIDALGNTVGVTGTKDDVAFDTTYVKGTHNAYLGIGASKASQGTTVQMELTSNQKAFIPNKVELQSVIDKITVPNPVDGMLVYNTNILTGLETGFYVYAKGRWRKMIAGRDPNLTIQILPQKNMGMTPAVSSANDFQKVLKPFNTVDIYEEGAYGFAVRLYGRAGQPTPNGPKEELRGVYYIWLLRVDADDNIIAPLDVAELNPLIFRASTFGTPLQMTYTVTLGAQLKKGDRVTLGLNHHEAFDYPWEIADQSGNHNSFFYWRITSFEPDPDLE